jgi:hypothetical protein
MTTRKKERRVAGCFDDMFGDRKLHTNAAASACLMYSVEAFSVAKAPGAVNS